MKPFLATLRGDQPARPPIWMMRQAGRYLPEYRALRTKAANFVEFCLTPDLATEVTLQPIRRFGLDAAILFADILLIPHAMGQGLRFAEGEGPRLDPVRDRAALDKLDVAKVPEVLAPVLETVRGVRAGLPPNVTLIGFAGGPWTVATYMIEGQGGTEHAEIRKLAWTDPDFFGALMDRLVAATTAYLIAQAEAGAEALQIFESWAGSVPAPLFDKAVIEPTRRIVAAVKARCPDVPIIGFPRAAGACIARYVRETGVDAVGVDHMTDLVWASDAAGPNAAVQGNLDPMLLLTGGAAMDAEVRRTLSAMQGRRFIFNLGHGVTPPTPPEHVARVVTLVKGEA